MYLVSQHHLGLQKNDLDGIASSTLSKHNTEHQWKLGYMYVLWEQIPINCTTTVRQKRGQLLYYLEERKVEMRRYCEEEEFKRERKKERKRIPLSNDGRYYLVLVPYVLYVQDTVDTIEDA